MQTLFLCFITLYCKMRVVDVVKGEKKLCRRKKFIFSSMEIKTVMIFVAVMMMSTSK